MADLKIGDYVICTKNIWPTDDMIGDIGVIKDDRDKYYIIEWIRTKNIRAMRGLWFKERFKKMSEDEVMAQLI